MNKNQIDFLKRINYIYFQFNSEIPIYDENRLEYFCPICYKYEKIDKKRDFRHEEHCPISNLKELIDELEEYFEK